MQAASALPDPCEGVGVVCAVRPVAPPSSGAGAPGRGSVSGGHRPRRPSWLCDTCGADWPCQVGQKVLEELHLRGLGELTRHMAKLMVWASGDLMPTAPAALYKRFVGWTLPEYSLCRVCGKQGHDLIPAIPPRLLPC